MDKTTDTPCESIVPMPGEVELPPLPWDLDTTNPRLNIPLKVGELVTALHQWGHEVYAAAQLAATTSTGSAPGAPSDPAAEVVGNFGGEGMIDTPLPIGTKLYLAPSSTERAQAAPEAAQGSLEAEIIARRIAITPEYEGGFQADEYGGQETPKAHGYGATPSAAIRALRATTDKGEAA